MGVLTRRWCAVGLLAIAAELDGAGAVRAQQAGAARTGGRPLFRIEAGALNPDALDAATMSFGLSAGVAWRGRTMLLARALRQSQNRNSGADLSRNARDLFSLLLERTSGPAVARHRQYLIRVGAGVMRRPRLPAAPVATLGLGVRYPVYRSITLVAALEDDLAFLPAASYAYDYFDPAYLAVVNVTVTTKRKVQSNFGFQLAVEWHFGS